MDNRQAILDTPQALGETLEKGRSEYEALVRQTRWGEGPIHIIGSGASYLAGLTGAYAFESLLGWPTVVRSATVFKTYAASVLRPRSIVLALSPSGETEETLDAARMARSRGATVLALTNNPSSALAQTATGVFLLRSGEGSETGPKAVACQQAAAGYIAFLAARVLKRHHPQLDLLSEDLESLPQHAEWVLTHLGDAARSFAGEAKPARRVCVVGGGFYHPAALQWALRLRGAAGPAVEGFDVSELHPADAEKLGLDAALVLLSGSRCRLKKEVHELAKRAKSAGMKVLSITDSNDRDLADHSTLAILLPVLSEAVGATVALVLLEWVAYEMTREVRTKPDRLPPGTKGRRGTTGKKQ